VSSEARLTDGDTVNPCAIGRADGSAKGIAHCPRQVDNVVAIRV